MTKGNIFEGDSAQDNKYDFILDEVVLVIPSVVTEGNVVEELVSVDTFIFRFVLVAFVEVILTCPDLS